MADRSDDVTRRRLLRDGLWGACLAGVGGVVGFAAQKGRKTDLLWQIDPYKCIACGNCATHCVLEDSAVKCMHVHAICGYCRICFGFSRLDAMPAELAAIPAAAPIWRSWRR